jgi:hypothetical protein
MTANNVTLLQTKAPTLKEIMIDEVAKMTKNLGELKASDLLLLGKDSEGKLIYWEVHGCDDIFTKIGIISLANNFLVHDSFEEEID